MTPSAAIAPLLVSEKTARELLLVRAFEEADPGGMLLSTRERERVPVRGAETNEDGLAPARRRAEALLALLRERVRGVDALGAVASADAAAPWLVPVALVLGLSTNVLGAQGLVNVLAFPLLGALVWNLVVYALLIFEALHGARVPPASSGGIVRRLAELALGRRLRAALTRAATLAGGSSGAAARARAALVADAGARFAAGWVEGAAPLLGARLRRAFHLAALSFVAGIVGGMYLRGLGFEYRAQWSSTFLGPGAVDALFAFLFAPARALAGLGLPAAAEIRAPASGNAAPWIHAWALSAALVVGLPRLALFARARARVRRLERALPLDPRATCWRRILAGSSGQGLTVRLLSLGADVPARALERLRELVQELLGARAGFAPLRTLDYGAEAGEVELGDGALCVVPVFALAQPPELEVHGRFLSELRARCEARDARTSLLVVLDASGLAALHPGASGRLAERRRAWERVLADAHLAGCFLDLSGAGAPDELAAANAALWSAAPWSTEAPR